MQRIVGCDNRASPHLPERLLDVLFSGSTVDTKGLIELSGIVHGVPAATEWQVPAALRTMHRSAKLAALSFAACAAQTVLSRQLLCHGASVMDRTAFGWVVYKADSRAWECARIETPFDIRQQTFSLLTHACMHAPARQTRLRFGRQADNPETRPDHDSVGQEASSSSETPACLTA